MPAREPIPVETFLQALPLFGGLANGELVRLAAAMRQIAAPRGSMLFRRGEACVGFHIVIYGLVKLAIPAGKGHEKVIEMAGPGESFGEAVMFLNEPYALDAQALEDSKLIFVPRDTVLARLEAEPRFAKQLLTTLSDRVRRRLCDVEMYSLRSARERVVRYLLEQLPSGAEAGAERITLNVRKAVIASRLNLTQEHFSRVLHELSAAGLIAVDRRHVDVPDIERLRADSAPSRT